MIVALKRDPVWLGSLSSPAASPILLLLGGDGQQVAVPAPLILAVSPLVRNILIELLPPAFGSYVLSLPEVTSKVLHVLVDILDTGEVVCEHEDEIEEVRQVFKIMGVEASLVSCHLDSIQVDQVMDSGMNIKEENTSEETEFTLNEENMSEVIVSVENNEEKIEDTTGVEDFQDGVVDSEAGSDMDEITKKFPNPFYIEDESTESEAEKKQPTAGLILKKSVLSVPDKSKYSCKLCSHKFKSKRSLKRHIESVHEQIKIPCNLCPSRFSCKSSLLKHIKSVHEQRKFLCDLCQLKFTVKCNLLRHIKTVHDKVTIPCSFCPSKFTSKRWCVDHMKKVHEQTEDSM